ncbi:hypothetical protein [Hirschia baltica]|uniref:Uncharacterized protein n=1 Tax=Hirschia baltica (strain ATCC 49814 / DSM 5838 / IFAM 1418) TaxID=582402 RepID=C6XIB6_HIRBI|nr:hypothetical protein [Hirschia baltica]ACT58942.1 conserved hypothetical protein [Hirschia baltica ATCC 49814]
MSFDRKLTLGVIVTIGLQLVAALMWTGAAAQRLKSVEGQLIEQRPVAERLARLEAEMSAARRQLDRIEAKVSAHE